MRSVFIKTCAVSALTMAAFVAAEGTSAAQSTGPSTATTPYVLPVLPGIQTKSILTVGDEVPKVGGGTYRMVGIPDGLGAFDNNDGTFTVVMNHELGSGVGVPRALNARGAFVSKWVINKGTLQVLSGMDLMQQLIPWDKVAQAPNPIASANTAACGRGHAVRSPCTSGTTLKGRTSYRRSWAAMKRLAAACTGPLPPLSNLGAQR